MSARRLRLAFFGTPAFAVPTLERLLEGPHSVEVVVSQPDRPRGRGRRPTPSPVATCAERAGVPVLRPERATEGAQALARFEPDLGVVVAFGQFLPKRIRELPRLGYLINAHASLLPRYRGAAPIARAILNGETETAVSVMRIEREMDAGPTALVRRTRIGPEENAGQLGERLSRIAADAIEEAVNRIAEDRVKWTPQDPSAASFAPKIEPKDAELDWREPAVALVRRVRAMAPRPGAYTIWEGERLRILAARAHTAPCSDAPGTVRQDGPGAVHIATEVGWLVPLTLQRAGGRVLDAASFLRGHPLPEGSCLGATAAAKLEES